MFRVKSGSCECTRVLVAIQHGEKCVGLLRRTGQVKLERRFSINYSGELHLDRIVYRATCSNDRPYVSRYDSLPCLQSLASRSERPEGPQSFPVIHTITRSSLKAKRQVHQAPAFTLVLIQV